MTTLGLINRKALIEALETANRLVARKSATPILSNVLLVGDKRGLWVTSTDLDVECVAAVRGAKPKSEICMTVGAHQLLTMLKKNSADNVSIAEGPDKAILTMGRLNVTLATLPEGDFPRSSIATMVKRNEYAVPTRSLSLALDRVAMAISHEETRYYLNGIYLCIHSDKLRFTATDGHRMAIQDLTPAPKGAAKILPAIIPSACIYELQRIAKKADEKAVVTIRHFSEKADGPIVRMNFSFGDVSYTTKLIDGVYPDYQRVIPTGNTKVLLIDRAEAIDAIKQVATIASNEGRALRMSMNGETTFSMTNPELGSTKLTVDAAIKETGDGSKTSPAMDIGMNYKYLLDNLGVLQSDEIEMRFADPGSPVLIRGTGPKDRDALIVQMPMRV